MGMSRRPANMKDLVLNHDGIDSQDLSGNSQGAGNTDSEEAVVCTPQNQPIEVSFTCPSVDARRVKSAKKPSGGSGRQQRGSLVNHNATPSRQSWPANRKHLCNSKVPMLRLRPSKLSGGAKKRPANDDGVSETQDEADTIAMMSQDHCDLADENVEPNADALFEYTQTQTQGDGATNELCTQMSMDLFLADSQDTSMDFVKQSEPVETGPHNKRTKYDSLDGITRFHQMTQAMAIPNPFIANPTNEPAQTFRIKSLVEQVCTSSMQRRKYAVEFAEVSVLGKGDFSMVARAVQKTDGQTYAVKQTSRPLYSTNLVIQALREVQALAAIPTHPNVLRFYSAWLEQDCTRLYIQTECCDALKNQNICPMEFGADLSRALAHVHGVGIMHGDVKPENVLIRRHATATLQNRPDFVLADFGLACRMHADDLGANVTDGDCRYLCPEILQSGGAPGFSRRHGTEALAAVDMFAFGMSLLEVSLFGKTRDEGSATSNLNDTKTLRQRVLEGELEDASSGLSCALQDALLDNNLLPQIIKMCVRAEPHQRPTAETVSRMFETESSAASVETRALKARIEALEKENNRLHALLGS
ncbi:Wee1-like protein kinase [Porphyridium purpureum]|uniref:Wee1-like protein kinase n=1 Tax=Porphyridium purpureum TaxID=35688 RepID=A0A5J4YZ38_PORPP|nr:Wee1-like protein kinase [Porphyridium purpureum]|eukprot:POR9784..scf209_3